MSHILSQWVNADVGLSHHVASADMDQLFRSGYLFAEILQKHKLIENLAAFQESFSVDGAIKNFTMLEPILRAIGVPITSTTAYEVISGKEGCSARLLYQIKAGLVSSSTQDMEEVAKKYNKKEKLGNSRFRDYRGLSDTLQERKGMLPKYVLEATTKQRFVEKEHEFFADRLKAKFRRNVATPTSNQTLADARASPVAGSREVFP